MPAQRARTAGWKHCLQQICDRRGSLELAIRPPGEMNGDAPRGDLLFRARLISIDHSTIRVEMPVSLGQSVEFEDGLELVAIMSIGQNRWMFHTHCIGPDTAPSPTGTPGLVLSAPQRVERCQRRRDYRIDTADLQQTIVSCN